MSSEALTLGSIRGQTVRLSPQVQRLAALHAARIAISLGLDETESSRSAYWDLGQRLRLWSYLVERVGEQRARRMRFLEIGSGMGLFTLTGRLLGMDVIGLEPSQDQYDTSLVIARRLFADHQAANVLIQAAGERLPLPDRTFDAVVSFQTLEHVQQLPEVLREVRRVLRPGGLFFSQFPNYASWYECHYGVFAPLVAGKAVTRAYLRLLGRSPGFLGHLQWVSPASIRQALVAAGFKNITVQPMSGPRVSHFDATIVEPLPYKLRRGRSSQQAALLLARLAHRLTRSDVWYPQIEFWATAAA